MGWWDTLQKVKDWSVQAWHITTNIGQFPYKMIVTALGLPKATIRTTRSLISHPDTRKIGMNILRIAGVSSLPIILTYLNNELQRRGQAYLEDEPSDEWMSTDMFIYTGLILLNSGLWIFKKRQKLETMAHLAILNVEASKAVAHRLPESKICQDCTSLRFMKGSVRDLIAYWSTELLIEGVRFIPSVGEGIATGLSIYHNGRYVATLLWSPYCDRHLDENLNEYPEFTLIHGLSHFGVSRLIGGLFQLGGIPQEYYESTVQQLALVGQVIVAGHSNLPVPVKESNRLPIDPVRLYKGGIKFSFDVVSAGLKVVLPPKIKPVVSMIVSIVPQVPIIPWAKIGHLVVVIWSHPVTGAIKFVVLPAILQGKKQMVNDYMIRDHWLSLRDTAISEIKNLEQISQKYAIRMVSNAPETTGGAVQMVKGIPKIVVEIGLRILRNEAFMDAVAVQRRTLEGTHSGPPPKIEPAPDSAPLRGQQTEDKITVHPRVIEDVEEQTEAAATTQEATVRVKSVTRNPTEHQLERKFLSRRNTDENRVEAKVKRRHQPSFFKEGGNEGSSNGSVSVLNAQSRGQEEEGDEPVVQSGGQEDWGDEDFVYIEAGQST